MIEKDFYNKVKWYNFILCILVIIIHAENTPLFAQQLPQFNLIEYTVVEKFARPAVAGFFLCSGYLFYRNFNLHKLPDKWKRRFFSTLLPFLLWNFLYYFIHYTIAHISFLKEFTGNEAVPFQLQEILQAVIGCKYNPVFWFMQFLILYILFCPLIYLAIKNKWVGILAILAVLAIDSGQWVSAYNETLAGGLNWLFIYMVGGYLGLHYKAWVEKEAAVKSSVFLAVIFGGTAMMFDRYPGIFWTLLNYLCGAVLIWSVLSWLRLPETKRWMNHTFFIYAVHFMVIQFGNKLAVRFWGGSAYAGLIIFFLWPVIIIMVSYAAAAFLQRFLPPVWQLLSGNRK